jgi:hypothetical protein
MNNDANGERKPMKKIPVEYGEDEKLSEDHFLTEEMIHREYAETGSTVKGLDKKEVDIDRVSYDPNDFNFEDETEIEVRENKVAEGDDDDDEGFDDIPGDKSDKNDLSPEEVALNKKIQNKLAKSQSKTITELYCFILLTAVKFTCKIDESKIYSREAAGQLSANRIIGNLPLIQHIKNSNAQIDELDIDDDTKEAIMEAMEIYLTSLNIQTSPGMNLLIAMGTPALTLFMQGFHMKREMNNLIKASVQNHVPQKQAIEIIQEDKPDSKAELERMQK